MSILLLTTLINGQDTITIDSLEKDTLYIGYDSMKVQEDCYDMMIEQRTMNTELKNQLDFLKNILEEEKKKR
tara:strand:+ start:538 stop:753 length:216 start_codon:yes stop_codon:yes gene_type:complete